MASPAAISGLLRGRTKTGVLGRAPQRRQGADGSSRTDAQLPQIALADMSGTYPKSATFRTMDLSYTPEEEAFRAEVRSWLDANLPAAWRPRGAGGYRHEGGEGIQERA